VEAARANVVRERDEAKGAKARFEQQQVPAGLGVLRVLSTCCCLSVLSTCCCLSILSTCCCLRPAGFMGRWALEPRASAFAPTTASAPTAAAAPAGRGQRERDTRARRGQRREGRGRAQAGGGGGARGGGHRAAPGGARARPRERGHVAVAQAAAALAAQRQHAEFAAKAVEALRSGRGGPTPGWMRSAPPCAGTVVLVLKCCMDVIPADSLGATCT